MIAVHDRPRPYRIGRASAAKWRGSRNQMFMNALELAAKKEFKDVVGILLGHGADPNCQSTYPRSPGRKTTITVLLFYQIMLYSGGYWIITTAKDGVITPGLRTWRAEMKLAHNESAHQFPLFAASEEPNQIFWSAKRNWISGTRAGLRAGWRICSVGVGLNVLISDRYNLGTSTGTEDYYIVVVHLNSRQPGYIHSCMYSVHTPYILRPERISCLSIYHSPENSSVDEMPGRGAAEVNRVLGIETST